MMKNNLTNLYKREQPCFQFSNTDIKVKIILCNVYNDNLLAINNSKIARSDTDAGYHDVYISLCIFFLLNYIYREE